MSQTLSGSESTLVSAYSFNNSINDLSANANNLTANGGAVATSTDSPMNSTEYGIITANSFSTNTTLTVQVPEGYAIPTTGGVSAVSYSTQDTPYGFPRDKGKWEVESLYRVDASQSSPVNTTWYNLNSAKINIPIGSWDAGYSASYYALKTSSATMDARVSFGTSSSAVTDTRYTARAYAEAAATNTAALGTDTKENAVTVSVATDYYLIFSSVVSSASSLVFNATDNVGYIRLRLAYV
jgi:hypothetical protein